MNAGRARSILRSLSAILTARIVTILAIIIFLQSCISTYAQEIPNVNELFSPLQQTSIVSKDSAYVEDPYIAQQIRMARAFALGNGVKRDPVHAAQLLLKAANYGSPDAQTSLGYLYAKGEGVPRDEREAYRWFLRAASEGYAPAQYDLAYVFLNGVGVQRDAQHGAFWLIRAADQGFAPAQVNLALLYKEGSGVKV